MGRPARLLEGLSLVREDTPAALAQPELLREREMTAPLERSIGSGRAVVFSTKSPNKDTPNEDAALLLPRSRLARDVDEGAIRRLEARDAGLATMLGIEAVQAAQRGYTAELAILETERGFRLAGAATQYTKLPRRRPVTLGLFSAPK